MLQHFAAFDAKSWKLTYEYPGGISKNRYYARAKLVMAVDTYLKLPKDQKPGGAWLIEKMESETRKIGSSHNDFAGMITSLIWVYL